jgi:hypothetical protein
MYITLNVNNDRHVVIAWGEGVNRDSQKGKSPCLTPSDVQKNAVASLRWLADKMEKGEVAVETAIPAAIECNSEADLDKVASRGGAFWAFAIKELKKMVNDAQWKMIVGETMQATNHKWTNSKFYELLKAKTLKVVAATDKKMAKGNSK